MVAHSSFHHLRLRFDARSSCRRLTRDLRERDERHLDLHDSQLTEVPRLGGLACAANITRLALEDNAIKSISNDTFAGLTSLSFLGLMNNDIASVSENAFAGLWLVD